jgi:tetratricopeptide (TPR) repeat protein
VTLLAVGADARSQNKTSAEAPALFGDKKLAREISEALKLSEKEPDSTINVVRKIIPMLRYDQDSLRGMCYFVLGEAYYSASNFSKASVYYSVSIKHFKLSKDVERLATSYNNLGLCHYLLANYDSAMIAFEQSLKCERDLDNLEGIAKSYQNIGLVFYQLNELDKAFDYMQQAIDGYEKVGELDRIAEVSNNLAVAYVEQNNYDKAEFYYQKALNSFEAQGDVVNQANVLNNIGSLHYYRKDYDTALTFMNRALAIFVNQNDVVGQIHVHSRMGDVYMDKGQSAAALNEFTTCEKLNAMIHIREVQIENLESLSNAYRKLKKFEEALRVSDQYHALKDSVYNEEKFHAVMEVEQQYEAEKAKLDLGKVKSRERLIIMMALSIVLIVLLLAVVIFLFIRQMKIREGQRLVMLEQKVLRTQMNPHFLFNALSTIQYYVLENQMVEAVEYLSDFSKLIRMVLQSSQEEYVTIETETTILEYYLNLQMRRFENKFSFIIHKEEDVDASKVLIPPMLGQLFVENIIEVGKLSSVDNGQLWISYSIENRHLVYRIQDNGLNKVDVANKRVVDSFSIALMMTRERIKLINQGEPKNPILLNIIDLAKNGKGKSGNLIEFTIPLHKLQ